MGREHARLGQHDAFHRAISAGRSRRRSLRRRRKALGKRVPCSRSSLAHSSCRRCGGESLPHPRLPEGLRLASSTKWRTARMAVEQFRQNAYDVVLMDGEMPVLDGYSAARCRCARSKGTRRRADADLRFDRARFPRGPGPQFRSRLHGPPHQAYQESHADSRRSTSLCRLRPPAIEFKSPWNRGSSRWSAVIWRNAAVMWQNCETPWIAATMPSSVHCGHQMAGTGGGYGFEPITEIGSALEESALAGDTRADAGEYRRPGPLFECSPSAVDSSRERSAPVGATRGASIPCL